MNIYTQEKLEKNLNKKYFFIHESENLTLRGNIYYRGVI